MRYSSPSYAVFGKWKTMHSNNVNIHVHICMWLVECAFGPTVENLDAVPVGCACCRTGRYLSHLRCLGGSARIPWYKYTCTCLHVADRDDDDHDDGDDESCCYFFGHNDTSTYQVNRMMASRQHDVGTNGISESEV